MKSAELMARAENALRTGQTENLFPVLARRALEVIEEEKQANRREWVKLVPMKGVDFAMESLNAAFAVVAEAAQRTADIFLDAFRGLFGRDMFDQDEYVLVDDSAATR